MKTLSQIFGELRQKNIRHYALLAGCCFFSVLLITAYVLMMRSPTVLNVLPEGGDSRKQVMMIFVLAVVGCGVFTTYASGLFFRYKSYETGILMALGASKKQIKAQMTKELSLIALGSCALGAITGAPLAWAIWKLFRLAVVDTQEMMLTFDLQAYGLAFAFSAFVIVMLFLMLSRYIRRTNIIDVVYEARKSEPIMDVPRWYGPTGIILLICGALLGYLTPAFCVQILQWYPPDVLTSITYLPAFAGLYMILLHTVVNGWRHGKNRYKNIIGTSMMKFHGRQTVRNMLVITMLVAGAYFAAFYAPMLGSGTMMSYNARTADFAFHYRSDQEMLTESEIRQMAQEEDVNITNYITQPVAVLGVDGTEQIETEENFGTTYTKEYRELLHSDSFLSESAYNRLTGETIDVKPGMVMAVLDDEGSGGMMAVDVTCITNVITGKILHVTPHEQPLRNSLLFSRRVLDDGDYDTITQGLSDEWLEHQIFFDVENNAESYHFAKRLFYAIVDRSGPEVELSDAWDPVQKMLIEPTGEPYWADNKNLEAHGFETIDYNLRDSSNFRMSWKYMPQFRVLDKADFVKTTAVFLMLFIFIAIVCFSAVIVIAYTRSLTIGLTNWQVYDDLRHLGANNHYLLKTIKAQISKVFFTPIATGTAIICAFYMMIMFFNDGGSFSRSELAGFVNCLFLIAAVSFLVYCIYRFTLHKVCGMLKVQTSRHPIKQETKEH